MNKESKWPLFRLIVPAFPELNVFSRVANRMTALGPVVVATAASKLWGWRVEVIDENNCKGAPKDENGFMDPFENYYEPWTDVIREVNAKAHLLHERAQP